MIRRAFTSVYKRHAVQDIAFGRERDHAQLAVAEAGVLPCQRSIPIETFRESQRHAMFGPVGRILCRIELDSHELS
jgi:hypothetical protein